MIVILVGVLSVIALVSVSVMMKLAVWLQSVSAMVVVTLGKVTSEGHHLSHVVEVALHQAAMNLLDSLILNLLILRPEEIDLVSRRGNVRESGLGAREKEREKGTRTVSVT